MNILIIGTGEVEKKLINLCLKSKHLDHIFTASKEPLDEIPNIEYESFEELVYKTRKVVITDDEQFQAVFEDLFKEREKFLNIADFFVCDEDDGVVKFCLHLFGVGDKIGADVTTVKLHAFNHCEFGVHCLAFLNGDDAVLAHLFHCFLDTQMPFLDYSEQKLLFQLRVNTESVIHITHLLLKLGKVKEIITIGSMSCVSPMPYFAIYSATKALLLNFFTALHYELKGFGVKVTTVLPGGVYTRPDVIKDIAFLLAIVPIKPLRSPSNLPFSS